MGEAQTTGDSKLLGGIFGLKRFFDFFIIACMYHHWSDSIDCLAKHYIRQNEPIDAHSVLRMPVKKYNSVTKSFDLDSNLDRASDQNIIRKYSSAAQAQGQQSESSQR